MTCTSGRLVQCTRKDHTAHRSSLSTSLEASCKHVSMSQFSTNMRNGWRSRHQSEIHVSFAQATDRELGADWQQLHAHQELGRHLRADRHGDAGRAGLVPRPAGDDADAQVGVGHGFDQGQIIGYTRQHSCVLNPTSVQSQGVLCDAGD